MPIKCMFRLTKDKQFVLNNRWPNVKVKPKHTLFFIPQHTDAINEWIQFLCRSHNKLHLFLHELRVYYRVLKVREFTKDRYKIPEIMIKKNNLYHIKVLKTRKVFKDLPINWRYFTNVILPKKETE